MRFNSYFIVTFEVASARARLTYERVNPLLEEFRTMLENSIFERGGNGVRARIIEIDEFKWREGAGRILASYKINVDFILPEPNWEGLFNDFAKPWFRNELSKMTLEGMKGIKLRILEVRAPSEVARVSVV